MQTYIVKTFIGVFALDENRKIILFKPFPKDALIVVSKLLEEEPKELQQIKSELETKEFVTGNKEIENFVKENLLKYAVEYKFVKNQIEFNQFLTKVNSELSKQKIKETVSRDILIVHVNNAIAELYESINVFIERLRELYSLHFPEMDRVIENHETYAKLIEKFGNRKNFDENHLNQFKEKSSGIDFTEEDINAVKLFAINIIKLYELREYLLKYLSKLLKEIAPNFSAIAGDIIAAKLISKAGGLERVAKMRSSVIQILGSEKALFRFLKSKGRSKSPKYGYIYNHPLIQNASEDKRGKIARLLAAKLSIAARLDFYSKKYQAELLKEELNKKVKEVLES